MITKVERNNLIKEMYEKGLLEQLYKEVIAEESKRKVSVGDIKLKQKIVIEDESGKETWSAFMRGNGKVAFLLDKEYAIKGKKFGKDNNYATSNHRKIATTCDSVNRLIKVLGKDAFIPLEIDLFSHDGLRDYGVCSGDLTGVMNYDMYRNNRENIDISGMSLSTPQSTTSGRGSTFVQCVNSFGYVGYGDCCWCGGAVRPFCILKSSIFVYLSEE